MRYEYVPLPQRRPLRWPNGARLALIVTINLEYWDLIKDTDRPYYAGGPPVLPDPLPGNVADFHNYSWREYGHRVGLWRMIDAFDAAGVPASCTMNAKMALERRAAVDAALARGWELVAHNYEQGDLLTNYHRDPEAEREVIRRTLAVYEQAVGRKAMGWLSSSLRGTPNTPRLLAAEGLLFFCDYMNDDQPYLIETVSGPIVAVPYSVEMNDFTLFHRRGMTTSAVLDALKEQFDVLYEEGGSSGRLMNVGLHPHVAGHPYRIRALREFLAYAKQHEGVWWARREDIASWYLEHHAEHIPRAAVAPPASG
jgi:peptidoglycan/xylan/chitin deacetylase (PgdA/CDA1 family)